MTFESWVKQHNPKLDWDFDNVDKLRHQLIDVVRESGTLDIESIKSKFPDSGAEARKWIMNTAYPNLQNLLHESQFKFYSLQPLLSEDGGSITLKILNNSVNIGDDPQ